MHTTMQAGCNTAGLVCRHALRAIGVCHALGAFAGTFSVRIMKFIFLFIMVLLTTVSVFGQHHDIEREVGPTAVEIL